MAKRQKKQPTASHPSPASPKSLTRKAATKIDPQVHVFGNRVVCDTEPRGHSTPRGLSRERIVLDASEGFIPLWAKDTTLRWRFRESSMKVFVNPTAAKTEIRSLLAEAILAWGDAVPVKFAERRDAWDFEIVMRNADDCDATGCVLASAFFPDAGRHAITIYPKMFEQSRDEQIATIVHEIGHVFGLRHFFADVEETAWPVQVFGTHKPFSIMNYGNESVLTADDKADLKRLYQLVWRGELTKVNGTPIKLVKPFHTLAEPDTAANGATAMMPMPRAASVTTV